MIVDPSTLERGDVVEFLGEIILTVDRVVLGDPGIVYWQEADDVSRMDSWVWSDAEIISYGRPGYVGPFLKIPGTNKYSHWQDNEYSAKQLLDISDEINAKLGHLRKGSK